MKERLVDVLAQETYSLPASIQGEPTDDLAIFLSDLNLMEAEVTNLKESFQKKEAEIKKKDAEKNEKDKEIHKQDEAIKVPKILL